MVAVTEMKHKPTGWIIWKRSVLDRYGTIQGSKAAEKDFVSVGYLEFQKQKLLKTNG